MHQLFIVLNRLLFANANRNGTEGYYCDNDPQFRLDGTTEPIGDDLENQERFVAWKVWQLHPPSPAAFVKFLISWKIKKSAVALEDFVNIPAKVVA